MSLRSVPKNVISISESVVNDDPVTKSAVQSMAAVALDIVKSKSPSAISTVAGATMLHVVSVVLAPSSTTSFNPANRPLVTVILEPAAVESIVKS